MTRYDAFILYADEDSEFADQVIEKLEQEYKLKVKKMLILFHLYLCMNIANYCALIVLFHFIFLLTQLCVKDRDLLPGIMFENEAIGKLIEDRCNRFLVIFSPNFLKSSANHFLVSYAQASALGLCL